MVEDNNLFMMCSHINQDAFRELPEGYYFDLCKPSELEIWKAFPFDTKKQAIEYQPYMTEYFNDVYKSRETLFYERCIFVRNKDGVPVATCFLWDAYGKINTLHWFKVKKEYENKGIGRALLSYLFKDAVCPIFLHTQPGSYRAIKLYTDFGFAFIKDGKVGPRENQLQESLSYLKEHMTQSSYQNLKFSDAPIDFLNIVSLSNVNEF